MDPVRYKRTARFSKSRIHGVRFAATLSALMALAGCAAPRPIQPVARNGYLDVELCPAPEGLSIIRVGRGPAQKVGIKGGDILTSYNDKNLKEPLSRRDFLWAVRNGAGAELSLSIKRGDRTLSFRAVPESRDIYPQDEDHTTPQFFRDEPSLEAWRAGMKASLLHDFEHLLLSAGFQRCGNYALVDRGKTDQILKELRFQMSGAVSPEMVKQVGRFSGASNLLFVDLMRYLNPSGAYEDDINARLVTVESDDVLASTQFRRTAGR